MKPEACAGNVRIPPVDVDDLHERLSGEVVCR